MNNFKYPYINIEEKKFKALKQNPIDLRLAKVKIEKQIKNQFAKNESYKK
jgi:hypothetical protein